MMDTDAAITEATKETGIAELKEKQRKHRTSYKSTSIMMDQTAKFSPRGSVTDFVGEAQIDNEATKQVLNGLPQLVFISPESIINNPRFHNIRRPASLT